MITIGATSKFKFLLKLRKEERDSSNPYQPLIDSGPKFSGIKSRKARLSEAALVSSRLAAKYHMESLGASVVASESEPTSAFVTPVSDGDSLTNSGEVVTENESLGASGFASESEPTSTLVTPVSGGDSLTNSGEVVTVNDLSSVDRESELTGIFSVSPTTDGDSPTSLTNLDDGTDVLSNFPTHNSLLPGGEKYKEAFAPIAVRDKIADEYGFEGKTSHSSVLGTNDGKVSHPNERISSGGRRRSRKLKKGEIHVIGINEAPKGVQLGFKFPKKKVVRPKF